MLRHGIIPPKEVVRPESAMAAIQGMQPKGLDAAGEAIEPVGSVVNKLFPYYRKRTRLGGTERSAEIGVSELTREDLERASLDARENATSVYADVYQEYARVIDQNRSVHNPWLDDARRAMRRNQDRTIADLEEKTRQAPEHASNEFMYQNRAEAHRELDAAKAFGADIPEVVSEEDVRARVWNPMPYENFRSSSGD